LKSNDSKVETDQNLTKGNITNLIRDIKNDLECNEKFGEDEDTHFALKNLDQNEQASERIKKNLVMRLKETGTWKCPQCFTDNKSTD
jgi:rubrerythrin